MRARLAWQSEKKKQSHADSALFVEVDEGAGEARGYLEAAWLLDGCEIAWAAAQALQVRTDKSLRYM